MALKHFLLTVPLSTLALTIFFYYIVPAAGLELQWYEMLAAVFGVNGAATLIAIVLIPDRRSHSRGPQK